MKFELIDLIGYTGGACMTLNMIPQLYKTYTSKSVNDISIMFLVLNVFGLGLYTIYGIIKHIYTITIPVSISFVISCMLCLLKYIYTKKKLINTDNTDNIIDNSNENNNKYNENNNNNKDANYKSIV